MIQLTPGLIVFGSGKIVISIFGLKKGGKFYESSCKVFGGINASCWIWDSAFNVPQIQAKDVYNFYMISHGGPGDPFWSIVIKGMKDMEKQLGGKVKATYLGPQKHSIEILLDFLDTALGIEP